MTAFLWFAAGLIVGVNVGVILAALLVAARRMTP